jgi:hypothetical protein
MDGNGGSGMSNLVRWGHILGTCVNEEQAHREEGQDAQFMNRRRMIEMWSWGKILIRVNALLPRQNVRGT